MSRFWSFAREEVPACRALVPVFAETTPRSVSLAPMLLRTEVVACRQAATTRGYTLTRGSASELAATGKSTPAREAMKQFRPPTSMRIGS